MRHAAALKAELVLGGAVVAHLVIVETMFFTGSAGSNGVLTLAKFFAVNAPLIMMTQIVLVSRLPWLDRRIGMDRLTAWHRWVGFGLLWTVLLHVTFVLLGYARLDDAPMPTTFGALAGVTASLLGMCGAALIDGGGRLKAIRRRVCRTRPWHVHMLVYVDDRARARPPVAGRDDVRRHARQGVLVDAVGARHHRAPRPGGHAAVAQRAPPVPGRGGRAGVRRRRLGARHRPRPRPPARPGRPVLIWRFPGYVGWWQANPFSLSAAPDGRSLRLTAKAVGTTSAGLRRLPVGTRVFVEGPYGAFTSLQQTRDAALLIAGGIGVTPIRALLEELTGPRRSCSTGCATRPTPSCSTSCRSWPRRGADVATWRAGPARATGGSRRSTRRTWPPGARHRRHRDVYVCGPPPMT